MPTRTRLVDRHWLISVSPTRGEGGQKQGFVAAKHQHWTSVNGYAWPVIRVNRHVRHILALRCPKRVRGALGR